MAEKICAAAVDAATYAIDKLYSYRVPDELREQVQIGTRVLVPFGFGNKRAEAVVLAFRENAGEFKLKPIVEVLDETPILTAEQLRLAAWMRERLYCTYFDCVHAMLPAGLWFKRNETYTLAPDADLAALRERDGEDGQVLALFEQPGQTLSVSEIRDRLRRVRLGARVPVLLDHHDLPFGVRPRDVPLLRRIHQDNRQVPAVRQHEPVHRNARHAEAGGGAARAVPVRAGAPHGRGHHDRQGRTRTPAE